MANVYRAEIDIKDIKPDFKPVFVQYDAAQLEIVLVDNGQNYDLTNISKVEFTHIRGDKTVIIHSGQIVTVANEKVIRYTYEGTEMDVLGPVKTSLAVFDSSNKKVSSHTFDVYITKDLRDEHFVPAEKNYGKLQRLIEDVEYLKEHGGGGEGGVGPQGPQGEPFTYDDFTPEQLEALRGPQGPAGSDANVTNVNVLSAIGFTPANSVDVGNVAQLETTNKNIVSAINEVKQYADNGKNDIVASIVGKGGTATINDTFSNLASAITNIPTGKKMRAQTFGRTNHLNIRTLDFRPSIVLIRGTDATESHFCFKMYVDSPIENPNTKAFSSVQIIVTQYGEGQPFLTNIYYDFSLVTYVNGFSCDLLDYNYSGLWVAIE